MAPWIKYKDEVLEIDLARHTVIINGRIVQLLPTEFRLLQTLVTNLGLVLSKTRLLDLASHRDHVLDNTMRIYISRLRRKLGGNRASIIKTIRGFGYRYNATGKPIWWHDLERRL